MLIEQRKNFIPHAILDFFCGHSKHNFLFAGHYQSVTELELSFSIIYIDNTCLRHNLNIYSSGCATYGHLTYRILLFNVGSGFAFY